MPQRRFAALRADLDLEVDNLRRLVAEADEWRPRLSDWPDTVRKRTAGGIVHDFYSGAERIFRYIAIRVDEDLPVGAHWHVHLLHRMTTVLAITHLSKLRSFLLSIRAEWRDNVKPNAYASQGIVITLSHCLTGFWAKLHGIPGLRSHTNSNPDTTAWPKSCRVYRCSSR